MSIKKVTLLFAAVLLFSMQGCSQSSIVSLMRDTDKKSPEYRQGYLDGCQSAKSMKGSGAIFFKDALRYDVESQYAEGWEVAFMKCSE